MTTNYRLPGADYTPARPPAFSVRPPVATADEEPEVVGVLVDLPEGPIVVQTVPGVTEPPSPPLLTDKAVRLAILRDALQRQDYNGRDPLSDTDLREVVSEYEKQRALRSPDSSPAGDSRNAYKGLPIRSGYVPRYGRGGLDLRRR